MLCSAIHSNNITIILFAYSIHLVMFSNYTQFFVYIVLLSLEWGTLCIFWRVTVYKLDYFDTFLAVIFTVETLFGTTSSVKLLFYILQLIIS